MLDGRGQTQWRMIKNDHNMELRKDILDAAHANQSPTSHQSVSRCMWHQPKIKDQGKYEDSMEWLTMATINRHLWNTEKQVWRLWYLWFPKGICQKFIIDDVVQTIKTVSKDTSSFRVIQSAQIKQTQLRWLEMLHSNSAQWSKAKATQELQETFCQGQINHFITFC